MAHVTAEAVPDVELIERVIILNAESPVIACLLAQGVTPAVVAEQTKTTPPKRLQDQCLWVPASIAHTRNRFVYGGVSIMPQLNVLEAGTSRYNALYNQTFVHTSAGQTLVSASTFTAQASAFGGTPAAAAAGAPPTGGGGSSYGGGYGSGGNRGDPPKRGSTNGGAPRQSFNASNPNAQDALNRKLEALEKAQQTAVRTEHLSDGRIRYYAAVRNASNPGPTRGSAIVTEYNTVTGQVRLWNECYDKAGNVNRVHPKMLDGQTVTSQHYPPTHADKLRFSGVG